MIPLDVSAQDGTWRKVVVWVEARRAELLTELDAVSSEDRDRLIAAVRRDELAQLLSAPADTRAATEARLEGEAASRQIY